MEKEWATGVDAVPTLAEDSRIDLMRKWVGVNAHIDRLRAEAREREDDLKEASAQREQLKRELIGHIDPDSLPQTNAKAVSA